MKVDWQFFIKQKLFQFRPHVMKKILLGVTGVRAEMRFCKAAQAYKVGFWAMAPASLYGRRLRELRQDDKATGQKALASLHLQRAAFGSLYPHVRKKI